MVALLALAARPVAAAAFEPACAALASATAPALKIDNTPHVFDRVNDYVYVRADVTTSTTLSGLQSIFVWGGGDGGCGVTGAAGMLFGIWDDGLGGKIFLGRQCTSTDGFYVLPLAEFTPTPSARYVVEMYYRAQTDELRIWVDDVEVTPTGTTYALEWSDGYASAGYGKHYAAETWGGTIHAIDFYECAWPNTPAAAPSPPASVLDSLKVHLVAEDFDAGTWADRISGLSFANAAGIAAPTLVTHGAMNGRKALRFGITDAGSASASGVEAPQTTFLSAAGQTGVTVFVVYRPIAYNTTLYFPFLFDMGMLATAGFGFGSEVNALHNFFTVNGAQMYTPTDHGGLIQRSVFESEEKTYVAAIRVKFKTGADDPGYQLAASQDSDVAVGDIFPKVGTSVEKFDSSTIYNTPFSLGIQSKAYDRANRFFRGYLAEFRWYADLLSDADVETIRSELVDAYVEPPTFVVEPQYGLDSLKLHLMADDLDAADGSPAGTWIDRVSGLALSTPSAGIAAPTLVDDAMNGHKALQFGFSSAGVVGATGFEAPVNAYGSFLSHPRQAGVTVFVVFRRDAHDGDASDEEQFLFDAGNGGLNADFSMRANAGDVRVGTPTAHGGKASVSSVSVSAGTTYVAAVRVKFGAAGRETGYQSVTSQDGYLAVGDMYPKEPIAVEGFTADTLDTTHPFSIGIASGSSNGDRTARFFKGSIAEIRYYGDLLSDADARRVQDALVEKYVPAADRSDADPARRATFGHAPTCAPVLDLVPPNNAKANNVVSSHAFVAGTVLYARMDVVWKTPSTWGTPPQTMILLLMGGSGDYSCGGWRLGFSSDERMYMDSQCNGPSGSGFSGYVVADGPFTHGARYVFEYYYDQVSAKAKMWSTCLSSCGEYEVQGALVERTPAGGATPSGGGGQPSLSFAGGSISVGYDQHNHAAENVRGFMGTIYSVLLTECAQPVALDAIKVHLVAEDFNAAGTWDDRISGLSFTAGIAAPTLVDGAMNGRKALRFGITDAGSASASGVEAPLSAHATFAAAAGQTGVTAFVAYRPIAYDTTAVAPFVFDWGVYSGSGFGFQFQANALGVADAIMYTPSDHGGGKLTSPSGILEAEEKTYVAAIRVKFSAGTDDPGYQLAASQDSDVAVGDIVPIGGTSLATLDANTVSDSDGPFSFGHMAKSGADRADRFFRGYVAEFRWYADLLSDADVEAVQRELSASYSFFSASSLKSAVDNCVAATIDPDLTLYPSCVAPAVPSGSGRFCCSRCGANCLHGGATDMPNWDVSEVTSFEGLFQGKTSFDEDVTGWSVPADANVSNMFLGATAFLAKFANCNTTATSIDLNACRRKVYPPSLAAFDGPPAAWDNRYCDFSASVVANGALGECNSSDVPKGSMCAPTCNDSTALAMKGVCGHEKQTPPACVCECKDKRAAFGFVVEQ
jgi:hypothetical protein